MVPRLSSIGRQAALHAAGLATDPAIVRHGLHDPAAATAAVTSLLASAVPPTALFSSQNLITLGTVQALRSAGAQHRTALVGFDDVPLADLLDPPVTVVAQDVAAIGTLAAQILFRRIDGDGSPPRQHIVPTRLVARGSGEIASG